MLGLAIGTAVKAATKAATNAAVNAAKKKKSDDVAPTQKQTSTGTGGNNLMGNMFNMGANMAISAAKSNAKPQSNQDIYQSYLGGNEHMDYINKNYAGGMNAYLQTQQNKYNNALASGDTDMLNRLAADSKRVGYSLQTPQQQMQQQYPISELNLPKYKPFDYQDFKYKDFSYDVNNDNIYKQYAEQFARQGKSAGEQALADSAAATGGMASSYANAANSQMQQAYAKKTADMVPVLEQQAYDKYFNERNFDYQSYLKNRDTDFQEHMNKYSYDRDDALQAYQDMWKNREYKDSRSDLAYDRTKYQEKFDYQKYFDDLNRKDTLSQRDIDNKYRQSAFDYGKQTDTRDYNYKAGQDAIRNSLARDDNARAWSQFSYSKGQDAIQNNLNWQKFNYDKMMSDLKWKKENQVEDDSTIRTILSSAFSAADPSAWLRENAPYMSKDEYGRVKDALKDLEALAPKKKK